MGEKLRIGIVGVGGISGYHIDAYKKDPRTELCAFCDIDERRLREKGALYGVTHLYTDIRDMARKEQLDAVSVCTWNAAHAPCAITALEAGWNVLCEKPMAMSEQEALQMKEAAQRNGKLLMVGFVRRFGCDTEAVKEFVDKGAIGELYYAKASYLRRHGNPGGWFGDKSRSGGGPLIDLGVHVIDLVRYLMGNPQPVSVYGATFQKLLNRPGIRTMGGVYTSASKGTGDICDVEDMASAMIRFDNGAVLHIETSFCLNLKRDEGSVSLFGTKSGVSLDAGVELYGESGGFMTDTRLAANLAPDFNESFDKEIRHFLSCVQSGEACRAGADDGITLMRILDAAYKSAQTGHEVVL